jgi:F-type H+-transporting ATPase subunit gamma
LGEDPRVVARVDGPSVAEEVPRLLQVIVDQLTALDDSQQPVMVSCLYHEDPDEVRIRQLLPPFRPRAGPSEHFAHPPVLNQSPQAILAGLSEHYVFATLHKMLYTSLWAENTRRVAHLEGAVRHLDQQSGELTRQSHALRQEEIIEEIEVMLLSAGDAAQCAASDLPTHPPIATVKNR